MQFFNLISKQSLNIYRLCIFFMNYSWVWEVFFHILLTDAAYSEENVHLHFPKGAECGHKMTANTLLYFCRIQEEISVSAPSSEMQSVGGNFCVSFLLTDAWYGRKFSFAFLHDCKMWLKISVSILLNDGDYRKKILSSFSWRRMQNDCKK